MEGIHPSRFATCSAGCALESCAASHPHTPYIAHRGFGQSRPKISSCVAGQDLPDATSRVPAHGVAEPPRETHFPFSHSTLLR